MEQGLSGDFRYRISSLCRFQRSASGYRQNSSVQDSLSGIVPGEATSLKADMARVQLTFSDDQVISDPIDTLAMITEESQVPLIIGLDAFPRSLGLEVTFKDRRAHIELL